MPSSTRELRVAQFLIDLSAADVARPEFSSWEVFLLEEVLGLAEVQPIVRYLLLGVGGRVFVCAGMLLVIN